MLTLKKLILSSNLRRDSMQSRCRTNNSSFLSSNRRVRLAFLRCKKNIYNQFSTEISRNEGKRHMAEFDADPAQYLISTRNRALRLVLDYAGATADGQLLVQKVTGHEAICGGFEHRILCVAESAKLALKDFIGLPAELQVVTPLCQYNLRHLPD